MLTAIVGINWGDEGKGRMVDLIGADYDIVCRYQGGNNAGHTVINDRGRFILNLLPSGILREATVNVMGTGMVIDIEHLTREIKELRASGVDITPAQLRISHRATICLPYHKLQDEYEEERLKEKKYGSTKRGIAPVYADKYSKKSLRIEDLLNPETLPEKVETILEYKNLVMEGVYDKPRLNKRQILDWLHRYGDHLLPYICNTTDFLQNAVTLNKNILLEAQLGALRDVDYGIYPYTTSSNTLAGYGPLGAGLPGMKLDSVIGIMKAYSSCVGEGPFAVEMFGKDAHELREAGHEYGAATGRPRRVGAFDVPASKYGVEIQGADCVALTKLDVLSYMKEIPVCVAYDIDGVKTDRFPTGDALLKAKPVYEYLPGFSTDISSVRKVSDLPENALSYVKYIESAVGCKVRYISVGPAREDYIDMD